MNYLINGVCYPPYARIYDRRKEGTGNWMRRQPRVRWTDKSRAYWQEVRGLAIDRGPRCAPIYCLEGARMFRADAEFCLRRGMTPEQCLNFLLNKITA